MVGDLSFISQTLVLPAVVPLLKAGGHLLMLVKPQFELQPGQVGKGGIVTRRVALSAGRAAPARRLRRLDLAVQRLVRFSPIAVATATANFSFTRANEQRPS